MLARYLPLALRLARRWAKRLPASVLLEDLEAAAIMGLWDGVQRLQDEGQEVVEAYLRKRILGEIVDELRREDWLGRHERARVTAGARETRVCWLEDEPSEENARWRLEPAYDPWPDVEGAMDLGRRRAWLLGALERLPPRERRVVMERLDGVAFEIIAADLGVSQVRVSQLAGQGIQRLRELLEREDHGTAK